MRVVYIYYTRKWIKREKLGTKDLGWSSSVVAEWGLKFIKHEGGEDSLDFFVLRSLCASSQTFSLLSGVPL